MTDFDAVVVDDTSSVATETASQPSSQASTFFTNFSTGGNSAFSALRRARSVADQLRDVNHEDLPDDVSQMPKIWIGKQSFVLESWAHKKRKKKSAIDKYGVRLTKVDGEGNQKGEYWVCNECEKRGKTFPYALVNGSTSSAIGHLRATHGALLAENSSAEASESEPPRRRQRTLLDLQKEGVNRRFVSKTSAESFRETLLSWIADADVPFSAVEHPAFRQLLGLLNEDLVAELLPRSGSTIKRWLEAEFDTQKELVKSKLATSPYMKHLTFDLWTSPNWYALLGINAHYADVAGELQTELLGLKRVFGAHSGENLAAVLHNVVNEFEVSASLGYFTADNADSNDCAIEELLKPLLPKEDPAALRRLRRIRCGNHVLNLGATAFLDGKLKDILKGLDSQSQQYKDLKKELDFLEDWRLTGAFLKLHNLEVWIGRSPQRKEGFARITRGELSEEQIHEFGQVLWNISELGGLALKQDNDTRWNSFFTSAERALKLKDPIDIYAQQMSREKDKNKRLPAENILTEDDWSVLSITLEILKPFKVLTKKFESK
jgi:hypothetical protein